MTAGIAGLCLAMQGSAGAAPSARAKTGIVPFETSPFPFDGRPLPGQDKPFFDVEKDGRRGHTSPRGGGIYWEDATYSDRRRASAHPQGLRSDPAGTDDHLSPRQPGDARARRARPPAGAAAGGAIGPQCGAGGAATRRRCPGLDGGRFYEPDHFRRFVEEACVAACQAPRRRARRRRVRCAARGDRRLQRRLLPDGMDRCAIGGLGDRLRGIILLDGLYSDFDKFADWIAARESAFFLSAHSRSSRDENAAFQRLLTERSIDFATELPARLSPGSVTFVGTGDEVVHRDFVTSAWVPIPCEPCSPGSWDSRGHRRLRSAASASKPVPPRKVLCSAAPGAIACAASSTLASRSKPRCASQSSTNRSPSSTARTVPPSATPSRSPSTARRWATTASGSPSTTATRPSSARRRRC